MGPRPASIPPPRLNSRGFRPAASRIGEAHAKITLLFFHQERLLCCAASAAQIFLMVPSPVHGAERPQRRAKALRLR